MPSNPFWEYSLKLYELPHVAEFCLGLQDAINKPGNAANINLLLFCCWAGSKGLVLTKDDFDDLESTIGDWHTNTVLPLRSQRRVIGISDQQKQNLLTQELAAERTEQDILFRWLEHPHRYSEKRDKPYDQETIFLNIQHNLISYCEGLSLRIATDNPLLSAAVKHHTL